MKLTNDIITIEVSEHGAELASLVCNGREYLWQADAKYWKRHSPVLFPIVGAVWNGEYRSHGNTYKLSQHGFARDMDFRLLDKDEHSVFYVLESSADTKQKYPYDFRLEIGYRIVDNRVRVIWKVRNLGTETMAFQIGAHPAFYWPMLSGDAIRSGVVAMESELSATKKRGCFQLDSATDVLPISVITEGGCVGKQSEIELSKGGYLQLDTDSFDNDAIIIENSLVQKVTLCDDDRKPYLSLEFASPLVGLWSPPKKNAPFVCIEPWYGRTDPAGYDGQYEDKPWIQKLDSGKVFEAEYDIIVE